MSEVSFLLALEIIIKSIKPGKLSPTSLNLTIHLVSPVGSNTKGVLMNCLSGLVKQTQITVVLCLTESTGTMVWINNTLAVFLDLSGASGNNMFKFY